MDITFKNEVFKTLELLENANKIGPPDVALRHNDPRPEWRAYWVQFDIMDRVKGLSAIARMDEFDQYYKEYKTLPKGESS